MYSILFLAVVSFACCFALTPLVTTLSLRFGGLDRPDDPSRGRKLHTSPMPRTGGVAIVAAYVIAIGLLLSTDLNGAERVNLPVAMRLLPAVAAIFALGLLDDVIGLNARKKLLGQTLAACLAFYVGGVQIHGLGGYATPEWASLPITVFWLVVCSNAFNLIDGVDGLAAGIGLFATMTTMVAALLAGNAALAMATAPLVGALLAFLRYNFNPASIFLGDCGSLTIGFLLGCFGAIWSQKESTMLGMTAPLMALAIPLLDAGMAVIRRFLRRQPIFSSDRNHVHHRLIDRGFSPRKVVLVLYGACGVAAAFSLIATNTHHKFGGLDGVLLVVFCGAVWIGVYLAGYVEFDAARHLVFTGTFRQLVDAQLVVSAFEKRIAAAVTCEDVWELVRELARECECVHVRMDLCGKEFEERYPLQEGERCCTLRVPLSEDEYVNFTYPAKAAVRHVVAMNAAIEALQGGATGGVRRVTDKAPVLLAKTDVPIESGHAGR